MELYWYQIEAVSAIRSPSDTGVGGKNETTNTATRNGQHLLGVHLGLMNAAKIGTEARWLA
jgi:hypothetical protein